LMHAASSVTEADVDLQNRSSSTTSAYVLEFDASRLSECISQFENGAMSHLEDTKAYLDRIATIFLESSPRTLKQDSVQYFIVCFEDAMQDVFGAMSQEIMLLCERNGSDPAQFHLHMEEQLQHFEHIVHQEKAELLECISNDLVTFSDSVNDTCETVADLLGDAVSEFTTNLAPDCELFEHAILPAIVPSESNRLETIGALVRTIQQQVLPEVRRIVQQCNARAAEFHEQIQQKCAFPKPLDTDQTILCLSLGADRFDKSVIHFLATLAPTIHSMNASDLEKRQVKTHIQQQLDMVQATGVAFWSLLRLELVAVHQQESMKCLESIKMVGRNLHKVVQQKFEQFFDTINLISQNLLNVLNETTSKHMKQCFDCLASELGIKSFLPVVTRSPFQTAIADWNMIDKLGSQCDLLRVRIPSIKTQVTLIKERCEEFGRETKVIAATSSHSPEVCNVQQSVECGISCRVISLIASTLLDNETPRLEALNSSLKAVITMAAEFNQICQDLKTVDEFLFTELQQELRTCCGAKDSLDAVIVEMLSLCPVLCSKIGKLAAGSKVPVQSAIDSAQELICKADASLSDSVIILSTTTKIRLSKLTD
jgi:hypothetical protein